MMKDKTFPSDILERVDYWVPALSKSVVCCLIFKDGSVTVGHCGFNEQTSAEFAAAKKEAYEGAVRSWKKEHAPWEPGHNE